VQLGAPCLRLRRAVGRCCRERGSVEDCCSAGGRQIRLQSCRHLNPGRQNLRYSSGMGLYGAPSVSTIQSACSRFCPQISREDRDSATKMVRGQRNCTKREAVPIRELWPTSRRWRTRLQYFRNGSLNRCCRGVGLIGLLSGHEGHIQALFRRRPSVPALAPGKRRSKLRLYLRFMHDACDGNCAGRRADHGGRGAGHGGRLSGRVCRDECHGGRGGHRDGCHS
jgi:hypothetical protein